MFAHGDQELRRSYDPLPLNFCPKESYNTSIHPKFKGLTSLGAVYSNYKTK